MQGLLERIFPKPFARIREETRKTVLSALESYGWSSAFNGEKWPGGIEPGMPSLVDHWSLRQNGRKVVLDSPEARTLINRSTDLVIGSGATLNLEPKYEMLGITPEAAEEWARNGENLFDLWANSPAQHKSGQFCFYEAMRHLYRGHKRDNEFFVRLYYNMSDPSLILPLQFEILDPNQIRGDAYTSVSMLNPLNTDGITRDSNGYEITYKVWISTPGTINFQAVELPRTGPKSGRVYMIHGYTPEFPGQGRGFSSFGLDAQNYKSVTDFKAASLEKAKKQSNIFLTLESESDSPTIPFPGMGNDHAGSYPRETVTPSITGAEGAPDKADSGVTSFHQVRGPRLAPGSMAIVDQPGKQKAKPFESTAPVVGQAEYIKGELQPSFAAAGMPIDIAFMDLKNNYNANQAMLLLNDLNNDIELFGMAVQCFDPIIEMLFSCAISIGRISAPGWQDPILHGAWMAHRWSRPPMPNIDRVKSATADKMYAELGAVDLELVAMRLNGSSFRSNAAKLKRQYEELPIPAWGWGSKAIDAKGTDGDATDDGSEDGETERKKIK